MNIQGLTPLDTQVYPSTVESFNSTSPSSSTSSGTSSTSSSGNALNSELSPSAFLQLISTELQHQDPTNPLDPSQFLGELVQFGTYDQLASIYSLLANSPTITGQGAPPSSNPSGQSGPSGSGASPNASSVKGA